MTTTAPTVGGRDVALAHYASRALLERTLAGHGLSFQQNVALRLAATADGPVDHAGLVDGVTDSLKVDESDARDAVEGLVALGLLVQDGPSRVRATEAGRELYGKASTEAGAIAARLYAGIPEEDLAATARVLGLVTERANAELATFSK